MPIYMKYGTIKGEVSAEGYAGWIELHSMQWGNGRGIGAPTGSSGSREKGTLSFSEMTVTKTFDASSVELFREALHGEGKVVEVHLCQSKESGPLQPYNVITLTNTMIASWSTSSGGDKPSESFSLNFAKIENKVIAYDKDNKNPKPSSAGYDLGLAKPF